MAVTPRGVQHGVKLNPPAASRRQPQTRRRARRSRDLASPGHVVCTKMITTTPQFKGKARGVWGGPEARRRQALAAAVLLAGGKARCGAPFGAWLGALEVAEHE